MDRRAAVLLVAVLLAGCRQPSQPPPGAPLVEETSPAPATGTSGTVPALTPSEPFGVASVVLRGPDGEVAVPVYVADDHDSRRRGLMHREHLPEGTGMLFVFPDEQRGGFWMKNTLIPLSIAFFAAAGDVRAVLDMDPCTSDPCPTYDPDVAYRYALEVNQGFFDTIGLDEAWDLVLPEGLRAAAAG